MSATMRFTRGSVLLASARVKCLRGTELIYAERLLLSNNHYSLNELRMRNKPHHAFVVVYHDNRRPDMRICFLELLDLEPRQLRLGRDHHRIAPRVHLGGALLRIVPRRHALGHDIAVGDGAEVAAGLWGTDHRHDGDVPGAPQQRPPPA